jgi:NADPH:quinone reductase-like Zn-dependent oxidoreductase
MKAVRIHAYGDSSALVYEDAPRPEVGASEILIRVHATTVNPFDCAARSGYMTEFYPYTLPYTPGLDVSGIVEEVGADVTEFAPGDAVFGRADPACCGANAEFAAVAASNVALKPASLDHTQAAALPHVSLTAWRALIDAAHVSEGQTVLIHAAAGGVGSLAVQLAKWRGAKIIGTASGYNMDFLRELGVDEAIDYTTTPFEEIAHDVDVVLDNVGGGAQERSWQVLKPGGILVSIVQPPSLEKAAEYGVQAQFIMALPPAGPILKEIATLVETGYVKPIVATVYPLKEIKKGHDIVWDKHVRGKIVIQVVD